MTQIIVNLLSLSKCTHFRRNQKFSFLDILVHEIFLEEKN